MDDGVKLLLHYQIYHLFSEEEKKEFFLYYGIFSQLISLPNIYNILNTLNKIDSIIFFVFKVSHCCKFWA